MAYWILKYLAALPLRFFFRIRVEGLEHVPSRGGAILAGNHLAVFDSFFVPLVVRRRITFVAKAEYFESRKTAWFFRAVGQIPIKRTGGSASQRALEAAKEVLESGQLFGIYPEGTRSPDGRLYKGHTGVARLALECKVPVLAVACIGTREAQPIGRTIPRLFMPITIRMSRPLDFSRYYGCEDDPLVLRKITDEIMFELRELSGQDYVNAYATRKTGGSEAPPTRVATLPAELPSPLDRTAAMAAS
ncbi:MAG: 1-acyl-sn-glycerol-3-phosphate acyltransferase [Actinobacteria bacterium]|nr:1-acyl-sn-glycerol-3-phosphate acyltransferase [Actinomycetota bacterium]